MCNTLANVGAKVVVDVCATFTMGPNVVNIGQCWANVEAAFYMGPDVVNIGQCWPNVDLAWTVSASSPTRSWYRGVSGQEWAPPHQPHCILLARPHTRNAFGWGLAEQGAIMSDGPDAGRPSH